MHLLFTSLVPAIWTAYYDLTDRMTFQVSSVVCASGC